MKEQLIGLGKGADEMKKIDFIIFGLTVLFGVIYFFSKINLFIYVSIVLLLIFTIKMIIGFKKENDEVLDNLDLNITKNKTKSK